MDLDPVRIIEAVLFSSSQPVRVSEMEVQTQLGGSVIRKAIKKLQEEYDGRGSAIELSRPAWATRSS